MSTRSHSIACDIRTAGDRAIVAPSVDREHGGDVYLWAQCAGIRADEIIDFSASINPLGPPASARKAFRASYREVSRYPDPYGAELTRALATWHGMQAQELLLGNGSTQLIYLLCRALRPRNAVIVGPAFSEYANALKLVNSKVRVISLDAESGFEFSGEKFLAAWQPNEELTIITTPNSVTGRLIPRAEIEKIARIARARRKFIVIDETFIDFVETHSVKELVRDNPYLVVMRSLTKYYALPGLRLGYLLGNAHRVEQLAAYLEPWSVNAPAQKVASVCLNDKGFRSKTECWLKKERAFLSDELSALKAFYVYESVTNFLLVRIEHDHGDARKLRSFLLGKKILIRSCESFASLGPRYFRIAVRRRKENRLLLDALKEWIA